MNEKEMESLLAAAPITEHVAGFSSEQMVACPSCSRKNAPKRLKCIYCGSILEGAYFADVPLSHTQLEAWQKGWNVIIRPIGVELDDSILSKMVDEFSLEKGFLMNVISSSTPLPLACVGTEEEATIWSRRLKNYGLRSDVIADDALIQVRLRRIREIRFRDTVLELVDFNTQTVTSLSREMLRTIVTGVLFTDKSEKLEKRKRGKSETIEESGSYSDELVVDIYFEGDLVGYRILGSGFDFSCLGMEKSRISAENGAKLIERILIASPAARSITNYRELRSVLSDVWLLDKSQEFFGPQRSGIMSAESRRQVSRTNLTQFTKFSRLQNLVR